MSLDLQTLTDAIDVSSVVSAIIWVGVAYMGVEIAYYAVEYVHHLLGHESAYDDDLDDRTYNIASKYKYASEYEDDYQ